VSRAKDTQNGRTESAGRPRSSRPWRLAAVPLLLLVLGLGGARAQTGPADSTPLVRLASIDGAIGPALADYLIREIDEAPGTGAAALVIRMDTPGGLVSSMRDIVKAILASRIPVIAYVAPEGAHAASAGTYILYASHLAAMAPGTNLGAATPIELGGGTPVPISPVPNPDEPQGARKDGKETAPAAPEGAAGLKAVNDLVALIKSLAEMRGRNAQWAEDAVRKAETLTAQEALKAHVVEILAPDLPALLAAADGRKVMLATGEVTLHTKNARVVEAETGWRTGLLRILTDPNIAFILMTIGMYGLIFELSNPGSIFPGILGTICLVIGLYALSVLPVSSAGLALLALGIGLIIAEAFVPGFGILGTGGLVSFGLGAAFLYDSALPAFRLAWPVIIGVTAATGGFLLWVVSAALGAHRRPVTTGREDMIGAKALVLDWNGLEGHVHLEGERWQARGAAAFAPGQTVAVTAIDGLVLSVEPIPGKPA
jgi:membrane-bound serine protease (ClpP class)